MLENKPWFDHYANVPHSLDYPCVTMYESFVFMLPTSWGLWPVIDRKMLFVNRSMK